MFQPVLATPLILLNGFGRYGGRFRNSWLVDVIDVDLPRMFLINAQKIKKKKKTLSTIYMYNLQTGVSLKWAAIVLRRPAVNLIKWQALQCVRAQLFLDSTREVCRSFLRWPLLIASVLECRHDFVTILDVICSIVLTLAISGGCCSFREALLCAAAAADFFRANAKLRRRLTLSPGRQIARRDGAASFCFAAKARANYTSPF